MAQTYCNVLGNVFGKNFVILLCVRKPSLDEHRLLLIEDFFFLIF